MKVMQNLRMRRFHYTHIYDAKALLFIGVVSPFQCANMIRSIIANGNSHSISDRLKAAFIP